jgi:hypothetical protein
MRGARLAIAAALIAVLTTALVLAWKRPPDPVPSPSTPTESEAWPGWGFTHTQYSADVGREASIESVARALEEPRLVQVQHIMGWGAENPEPSEDDYDFDSLDRRIQFIRDSGGVPVITLCCAPDWMKGGEPGETDWERLTEAPLREHFDDFAELAATVARRYPDVRHFMVWNEFKGFFDDERNRWDAEAYTDLYNAVYDTLKDVDPDIEVGGPYLDIASEPADSREASQDLNGSWGWADQRALDAFEYWLDHNGGADFVVVDGHATARDTDEFTALGKLSAVNAWITERTDLPLWWAEWYVEPSAEDWRPEREVALRVAAMIELARSGVDTVLYWNPNPDGTDCATCLWTDTWQADGGRPLPFLTDVLQRFVQWFPPGTVTEDIATPSGVTALATAEAVVMVNTTSSQQIVSVAGEDTALAPYETRWIRHEGTAVPAGPGS